MDIQIYYYSTIIPIGYENMFNIDNIVYINWI